MLKRCILVLLAAYSVHCNVTTSVIPTESARSFLDATKDMFLRAKHNTLNGSKYSNVQRQKAVDCADILEMGYKENGIYQIWPIATPTHRMMEGKSLQVYCDMKTDGGGWIVVQRRGDFKRHKEYFFTENWSNYKRGFGNIEEDFWLGNDNLFALTNQKIYSVRFDLRDVQGEMKYAHYDEFWIENEERNYTLHINLYKGDAGDGMMGLHNNNPFSTFDHDNLYKSAKKFKGGWWYNSNHVSHFYHHSNLNGLYYKGKHGNTDMDGISWHWWKGDHESMEWTEIKIRPKYFRATFP